MEMDEPGPSATEPKKRSKVAGVIERVTMPRNSPFGPVTLQATTIASSCRRRLCTSSIRKRSNGEPDLKALKKLRSAISTSGTGQCSEELIKTAFESNRLTPATSG